MAAHRKQVKTVAIIMAGGSGTRFWPLSTKALPKQYVNLIGKNSLIQDTVKRLSKTFSVKDTFIVSTISQKNILRRQLPQIKHQVFEPEGKNTAPCLMLAAKKLIEQNYSKETVLGVFPADHTIAQPIEFNALLKQAIAFASSRTSIVTLGIIPDYPHTGYGYIEKQSEVQDCTGIYKVRQFKEKPDLKTAEEYIESGNYYWNAGIFLFSLETIVSAFEKYVSEDWAKLLKAKGEAEIKKVYKSLTANPIDIAVLEKSSDVYVIPASMGWSDIGSWNALSDLITQGQKQNHANQKNILFKGSENNFVHLSTPKHVALIGCDNLIVVETRDSLLICRKDCDQDVREASKKFDK